MAGILAALRSLAVIVISCAIAVSPVSGALVVVDAAAFSVTSDSGDAVTVDCAGGFVRVFDDGAPTTYTTSCAAVTSLAVSGGMGDNSIDLSGVTVAKFTSFPPVTIQGAFGVDTITGSGLGDSITGDDGNDVISGGAGNDTFTWDPGDDNDLVTGDAGTDTLHFNGSGSTVETVTVVAEGSGFDLMRDLADVNLDLESIEILDLDLLNGDDILMTVPLESVTQNLDGGDHVTGDSVSIDFGDGCTGQSGPITATGFETVATTANTCTGADIDNNGVVDALTDGLLLIRYAFGFRDATLVAGAVAGNCGRCDADDIEAYIARLY